MTDPLAIHRTITRRGNLGMFLPEGCEVVDAYSRRALAEVERINAARRDELKAEWNALRDPAADGREEQRRFARVNRARIDADWEQDHG